METYKIALVFAIFGTASVLGQYDTYQVKSFRNCQEANLCCESLDNKCYVPSARKMDGSIGKCYCDTKCLEMGDCCSDFQSYCKGECHQTPSSSSSSSSSTKKTTELSCTSTTCSSRMALFFSFISQSLRFHLKISGPSCSKLTTSLVNDSLKFQTLILQIHCYFLLKKCENPLHCKGFSHFFNKK